MSSLLRPILAVLVCMPLAAAGWVGQPPPDMPGPGRIELAAIAALGKLYVIGGLDERRVRLARVDVFDPTTNAWSRAADVPTGVEWPTAAFHAGKVYIAGGWLSDGRKTARVFSYSPSSDRWAEEGSLPSARTAAALVSVRGKLLCIGGELEDGTIVADVLEYRPKSRSWAKRKALPRARWAGRAIAVGDRLFVVGGLPRAEMKSVLEFDFASQAWKDRASLAFGRHSPAVGVLGGRIAVAGGANEAGMDGSLELYDPVNDVWSAGPGMPRPRDAAAGGVVGDALYVFGGRRDRYLNTVEVFSGNRWASDEDRPPAPAFVIATPRVVAPKPPKPQVRALKKGAPDDFALIVGVDHYRALPAAEHAEDDAQLMKAYAGALGVPEENVVMLLGEHAAKADIDKYLEEWLPRNLSPDSRLYVYFSGHGAPEPADGTAFLVPWDGDASFLRSTAYPVSRLIEKLGALKAKEIIVALDACFSGAGGRSVIAKGLRPLVHVQDPMSKVGSRVVVFTASSADEVSGSDDRFGHGLFTYYFAKGLDGEADADHNGLLTVGELAAFVREKVSKAAHRQNREQTPQLRAADPSLALY